VPHPLVYSVDVRLGPILDRDMRRRLCRSRDFLAARFDQPLRLNDAAREAFLSPYHYHRLFSEAFGETPHQFLSRQRIEQAKRLLALEMPVTEVCLAVGFESLGSFSSRFRAVVGTSPSEFRRNSRSVFAMPKLRVYKSIPACYSIAYSVRA